MSALPYPTEESRGHLSALEVNLLPRTRQVDVRYATVQLTVGNVHDSIEVECRGHIVPEEPGYALEGVYYQDIEISDLLGESLVEEIVRRVSGA